MAELEGYVCPPCGHADIDHVYDEPGSCPICGMELVKRETVERPLTLGILLFEGVQIIDYAAPWEVFGQARYQVHTVSPAGEPLTTSMGMRVIPDYGFADAPTADVLLVPGGQVHDVMADADALAWVRRQAAAAEHVLSVCNGAFILAEAGLLDGLAATTFFGLLDDFEESYGSRVTVVRDRRFVDNGKIVTTAGLSSGIDGSLHVISKALGLGRAQNIALHLEYDWQPDAGFARGALASSHYPDLDPPAGVEVEVLATAGDRDRWEARYRITGRPLAALASEIQSQIEEQPGWKRLDSRIGEDRAEISWSHADEGGSWRCDQRLERTADGAVVLTHRIRRVG